MEGIADFAELSCEAGEKACPFSSFKRVEPSRRRADISRNCSQGKREIGDGSRLMCCRAA